MDAKITAWAKQQAQAYLDDAEDVWKPQFVMIDTLVQDMIEPVEGTREEIAQQIWQITRSLHLLVLEAHRTYLQSGYELSALREELGRADAVYVEQVRMAENRLREDDGADMTPSHRALLKKAQAYLKENPEIASGEIDG